MKPPDVATLIAALPCWRGPVRLSPLDGGMTNRNFRVDDGGASFVVRLGEDIPSHGIVRTHEQAVARAAHAAGLSPELVYAAPGVMVSRFVDGRTLSPQDVRMPERRDAIVGLLQVCHHNLARHLGGPVLMFWVFQVIGNYLDQLGRPATGLSQGALQTWAAMAHELAVAVGPVDIVFGHNDLLAGNLIDDGDRLWLIDWEYAGFNSPLFDLANLSINNYFDSAQCQDLLARYFRQATDARCWRAFLAMRCASALRETLWGLVSRQTSVVAFDYATYAHRWQATLDETWQEFNR